MIISKIYNSQRLNINTFCDFMHKIMLQSVSNEYLLEKRENRSLK